MAFTIDSKKIATNTIALYIRLGVTMVISFFMTRVMLQQLGTEDYGLNNVVASVVSMFSFINGSMGTAVQRFYSIEIGKGNHERLGRVFGVGLYLHIIVACVTLLLAEVFAFFFLHKLNIPPERLFAAQVVFQISMISLALNIINVPYTALLRAREMFSKTAIVDILQAILRLVVLYLLVSVNYDKLITLSVLNLGITLFYVGTLFFMARRFKETHMRPKRDRELIKQMLTFISMLLVTVLAQLIKTQGIVILINLFFGLIINAAYAVAVQVSHMVNSFVTNFKQSMVPQMMSAYGAGDRDAMTKIVNMGTKITFLLMLMISIPVIFEAQFVLDIWLETPPEHAANLVALVLISINISSFTYFQYQGVHATGNILGQQIWMSSLYLANIIIIYILFKLGAGFENALYVNMAISAIQCGVNIYYAHKNFDYNIRQFIQRILIPCVLTVVLIIAILLIVIHNIHLCPSGGRFCLITLIAEVLILGFGYIIVLNQIEKAQVVHFVKITLLRNKCK